MWVLIIVATFYNFSVGGGGSVAISQTSFSTSALCVAARNAIGTTAVNGAQGQAKIVGYCVQQG